MKHDVPKRQNQSSAMKKIRIILADDQLLIRAGIRALVETLPDYELVAECADGHEAIAASRQYQPDVILLDIAMPGPSGIEVANAVRRLDGDIRILMLSSIDRREIIDQAINAGANGYLLKDFVLSELHEALQAILSGQRYLSPRIRDTEIATTSNGGGDGKTHLTARQLEVLRLVASGKTTKEIARDLGISPKTVEFHRSCLMQRIGAHDVTGLTRFAVQNGVLC
ncbi:response regulator transcription factor [Dechloromonas sp. XY25]|uniref:Response regulator transcription factor n=1 Tax=Dechloromonas hankyongensis TaxID=2908002 RepID=A0ABS9K3D3_9RHOO|nr:response regulator transcription factor [Dechloromonas hankyongensis]MCG2577693.1 response regulator transcription factor [Dechloromonas hankyongensis]